jgi:hypothetical protein
LLGYAWAAVDYCPYNAYYSTLIAVHFFVDRQEAETAKSSLDERGCCGCCSHWHRLEYLPITSPLPQTRRNPYTGRWDLVKYEGDARAVKTAALPPPPRRAACRVLDKEN